MKKENGIWVVNSLYKNNISTKHIIPFETTLYHLLLWNFFEVSQYHPWQTNLQRLSLKNQKEREPLKPLQEYYKPNYVWVQKTNINLYITDLDENDLFRKLMLHAIDEILKNEIYDGYLTLTEYYRSKNV